MINTLNTTAIQAVGEATHAEQVAIISSKSNDRYDEIYRRFRRCAPACQPHHCCRKSHCVCIHDYWGPVCYCKK